MEAGGSAADVMEASRLDELGCTESRGEGARGAAGWGDQLTPLGCQGACLCDGSRAEEGTAVLATPPSASSIHGCRLVYQQQDLQPFY